MKLLNIVMAQAIEAKPDTKQAVKRFAENSDIHSYPFYFAKGAFSLNQVSWSRT